MAAKGHSYFVVDDQPVEVPNVMLAVADGVGLESVTHQTSSVGFCVMVVDIPPQETVLANGGDYEQQFVGLTVEPGTMVLDPGAQIPLVGLP